MAAGDRALVLAGGGAAGNAWELGLIAGLAEGGVDLVAADLVVGTSAGSTVAAQITCGTTASDLYAAILTEVPPPRPAGGVPGGERPATVSGPSYLEWSDGIIAASADPADMRRRMGAAALEREAADISVPDGAGAARWRKVVASRLPDHEWPEQRVVVVAVDAPSGEPVLFDRDSGVDLVDAVAASTSAMTPYRIGEQRLLNGGYRRSENADLAQGFARVVVLSPFGGRSRMPAAWRMDLASQVEDLEASGSRVETVFPDSGSGEVFDANALDPATRLPAGRGGHAQGLGLAPYLSAFWN
jgi:NTE family protein